MFLFIERLLDFKRFFQAIEPLTTVDKNCSTYHYYFIVTMIGYSARLLKVVLFVFS